MTALRPPTRPSLRRFPARAQRVAPHLRLVDRVKRRWALAMAAERASAGWIIGAAAGVAAWAAGSGAGSLVLPPAGALLALLVAPPRVSRAAAADRIDQRFDTQELLGTAIRLDGPGAAWLATAADERAARLRAADVPVWRRGRAWWVFVALITTVSLALPAALAPDRLMRGTDHGAAGATTFASRSAPIASQTKPRPASPADTATGRSPDAGQHRAGAHFARVPALGAGPAAAQGNAASPDITADGAAAAAGAGGGQGAASTPALPVSPATADQGQPIGDQRDGGADTGAAGGRLSEANETPAAEPRAGTDRAAADRPRLPNAPVSPPAAQHDARAPGGAATSSRIVPPPYRDLVRRYFAGD